jgi:hypothetical protein
MWVNILSLGRVAISCKLSDNEKLTLSRGGNQFTRGSFKTAVASSGFLKAARHASSRQIFSSFIGPLAQHFDDGILALVFAALVITGAAGHALLFFRRVPTMEREKS